VPTVPVTAQSNRRALDLALCGGCFGRSRSSYRTPEGLRPALDNPDSRAQNPVHCDPGHGHPKRPVSLVEARELGPESVGRLSILRNHSLSRSKLLKQLRFLFFQRIPDAPKL